MADKKPITNATRLEVPAGKTAEVGKPLAIQLAPVGDYPQWIDDEEAEGGRRKVVQKVDEKAIDALVEHFKEPVLVDADHSSEFSTDTKAMAWVVRLFKDADKGLMAEIEPTSEGAEKINGKVYRFVSAAWMLDDDDRPYELVSVGLTNRPNLPVAPMLNSQAGNKAQPGAAANADGGTDEVPSATASAGGNQETTVEPSPDGKGETKNQNPKEGKPAMDIRAKLGLAETATDEEVEQALDICIARAKAADEVANALGLDTACKNEDLVTCATKVVEDVTRLQNAEEAAQEAQMNAEADAFVEENKEVLPDDEQAVEALKEQYKADKDAAEATVANFRRVFEKAQAVANAKVEAAKKAAIAKAHVQVNAATAKKPVALNIDAALAEAKGDPAKENEILRNMKAAK